MIQLNTVGIRQRHSYRSHFPYIHCICKVQFFKQLYWNQFMSDLDISVMNKIRKKIVVYSSNIQIFLLRCFSSNCNFSPLMFPVILFGCIGVGMAFAVRQMGGTVLQVCKKLLGSISISLRTVLWLMSSFGIAYRCYEILSKVVNQLTSHYVCCIT